MALDSKLAQYIHENQSRFIEDIVRLDCEYIDNWSLWLDCKILAKTVVKVMRGEGW